MSFDENFFLVLIAGIVSVLTTIVTNLISRVAERRLKLNAIREDVVYLAENLEVSILNNNPQEVTSVVDRILLNYSVIGYDAVLSECFKELHASYCFLAASGYESNPNRISQDIDNLCSIRERLR